MSIKASILPLCVDLDGTLCKVDTLIENLLRAFRRQPWIVAVLPFWLIKGKAYLKNQLAIRGEIDTTVLPYNSNVLAIVKEAKQKGRYIVLVTGSNSRNADKVNEHLKLFDEVIASNEEINCTGKKKVNLLVKRFGENGYEYIGNGLIDIPVWEKAGAIITVNARRRVVRIAERLGKDHQNSPREQIRLRDWLKAIRIHQWSKNALLFLPLITSHQIFVKESLLQALLAFICFGLCASPTYIFNDLLDLDADRHHKNKKHRPFAAGSIPVGAGILVAIILLVASMSFASLLSLAFFLTLLAYLISTLLYSFILKKVASLDVLTLAGLYTLRIIAGAFAINVPLSFWLLAFSMFFFLSLALVKRVAELVELDKNDALGNKIILKAMGREYSSTDAPLLKTMGACSGYLSALVLALYINSTDVLLLYKTPEILWFIIPLLLLWITRLWIITSRGYMSVDPIVFSIKDPETWITLLITGIIILLATFIDGGLSV